MLGVPYHLNKSNCVVASGSSFWNRDQAAVDTKGTELCLSGVCQREGEVCWRPARRFPEASIGLLRFRWSCQVWSPFNGKDLQKIYRGYSMVSCWIWNLFHKWDMMTVKLLVNECHSYNGVYVLIYRYLHCKRVLILNHCTLIFNCVL